VSVYFAGSTGENIHTELQFCSYDNILLANGSPSIPKLHTSCAEKITQGEVLIVNVAIFFVVK
jgi:hypothetical protein